MVVALVTGGIIYLDLFVRPSPQQGSEDVAMTQPANAQKTSTVGQVCTKSGVCHTTKTRQITAADMGSDWPFANSETAEIVIASELGEFGRYVVIDDQPWAVTGAAASMSKRAGITIEISGRPVDVKYFDVDAHPEVDRIWKKAPAPKGVADEDWELRISMAALIEKINAN